MSREAVQVLRKNAAPREVVPLAGNLAQGPLELEIRLWDPELELGCGEERHLRREGDRQPDVIVDDIGFRLDRDVCGGQSDLG